MKNAARVTAVPSPRCVSVVDAFLEPPLGGDASVQPPPGDDASLQLPLGEALLQAPRPANTPHRFLA